MSQEIDYSSMPRSYVVCWNRQCPRRQECLRQLAAEHLPEDKKTVMSVNLRSVTVTERGCPQMRLVNFVRNTYGMRHIYDDVRVADREPLYRAIWMRLGNTMYYRYRNGKRAITPEVQAVVESAFHQFGYTAPIRYDRYADELSW